MTEKWTDRPLIIYTINQNNTYKLLLKIFLLCTYLVISQLNKSFIKGLTSKHEYYEKWLNADNFINNEKNYISIPRYQILQPYILRKYKNWKHCAYRNINRTFRYHKVHIGVSLHFFGLLTD